MSKKHFIAMADAVRVMLRDGNITWGGVEQLADFNRSQNYNFKRDRWLDYISGKCGKNGGKVK